MVLASLLTALAACYRAPKLEGPNQVYDPNVEATMLKDSGLSAQSWDVVDNYMENLVGDPNGPGCAVGIARGGTLVYLQGYGRAVVGGEICNGNVCVPLGGEAWSVGTMGAVGSVAKTFTAAAALRMHELGLLNVNHAVGSYLSTSNGKLSSVPVYRLLQHNSGVGGANKDAAFAPNWEDGSPAAACKDNDDPADASFCNDVKHELARPATAFDDYEASETVTDLDHGDPGNGIPDQGVYSNVGYSVAGAVVDAVAATTPSGGYEAWIWDNIGQYPNNVFDSGNLLSLALTHSWRDNDIPHRAVGYGPSGGGFVVFEAWSDTDGIEGWEGPSGGWAMTIGDLTRFAVALNTGKIVGNALLQAMRLDWTDLDEFDDDYGMGTFLGNTALNEPPYWHGGIIGGHTSVWTWWDSYEQTGKSLAIAIMCNRSDLGPFPLRDHARYLAFLSRTSDPQPRAVARPSAVGIRSIGRGVFALDDAGAWQAEPEGAFVSLAAVTRPLFLHVAATGRDPSFWLSQGSVRRGATGRLNGLRALGSADFSRDPWFTTRPTDVSLETKIGVVKISDLVVEGAFDDDGASLTDVSLTGVLDARQANKLVGRSYRFVCGRLSRAGARCEPCSDGVAACVSVRYTGLAGHRLNDPFRSDNRRE